LTKIAHHACITIEKKLKITMPQGQRTNYLNLVVTIAVEMGKKATEA